MPNKWTRASWREFQSLKRAVKRIYSTASKEVAQQAMEFVKAHEARAAKYLKLVEEGKMKREDYDAWLRGQVFQGKQWQTKLEQMANTLYNADNAAIGLQNKARMNVFAQNANAVISDYNKASGRISFNLYDANAVQRLIRERPSLLPPRSVGKDKAYKWYMHRMVDVMQQGIVQGKTVQDIALAIGKETGESSMTSMLRNARTGFTGATNAGKWEMIMEMAAAGVNVKKQWLATPDNKTRDTHAELNGEICDPEEPFMTSAGNELQYPGDPSCNDPGDVWNCRCSLEAYFPEYD